MSVKCITGIVAQCMECSGSTEKAREGRERDSFMEEVVFLTGRMRKLGQMGQGEGKATAIRERPLSPYLEEGQS